MVEDIATPNRVLKVAAAQYPLDAVPSLSAWLEKLNRWVGEGARTGADLLVFPEYNALEVAATFGSEVAGDLMQSLEHVANCAGKRTEIWAGLAKDHGVTILAGSGPVRTSDGAFRNASQLITPSGLIGEQHKLMITPFERDWGISPGSELHVFKTPLATFAITTCYDSEFPLIARAAARAGADCILVPSCTERVSGYHRVRTGAMARALENTIVTVHSPTVGDAPWSPAVDHNVGAAGIYVPAEHGLSDTGIVAMGELNEPGWVYGEIDLTRFNKVRTSGEMRNFNDWELQPGSGPRTMSVETVDLTA